MSELVRWFVCDARGEPTGWACGMSEPLAIRQWLAGCNPGQDMSKVRDSSVARLWRGHEMRGYSVKPFLLVPAPPTEAARDE